uniref:Uncharacterized protein n=1 Tax=Rhizophora mucronata TaxID=61149 RepID=A0A2P2IX48_RHIMU
MLVKISVGSCCVYLSGLFYTLDFICPIVSF